MNNPVAHHKYALFLIASTDDEELEVDKTIKCKIAQKHLEESIKQGFAFSCFLHARISYEFFHEDDQAYKCAREGALQNEKYSKCLLGYFTAHGIGTKKDHKKGVEMMLESGADDFYQSFATDIGIYYSNLNEEASIEKDEKLKNEKIAFKWFEKAFNMKQTKASINNYGICFLKGFGISADIEKAKEIFTLGVQKEDPTSMYHMEFILEATDSDHSLELCKKTADEDHSIAQLKCKKNEELMENKEERTFEMKYRATLDYAINLYNSKQYSQAFDYFSVLSSYNDPVAIYFVGVMMFNGFGCPMNRDKSYEIMCYLSSKGINKASEFIEQKFNH